MNEGLRVMSVRLGINTAFATWKECADVAYHRWIACKAERDELAERLVAASQTSSLRAVEIVALQQAVRDLKAAASTHDTKKGNP